MNDDWKALLWLVGFLVWLFGTPIVAMYILWKWQTLDAALIALIILLPLLFFTYLYPKCGKMKVRKFFVELFNTMFPSALAFVNFMCMIAFLLAMICSAQQKNPLLTIICAFAGLYCLNEWERRTKL